MPLNAPVAEPFGKRFFQSAQPRKRPLPALVAFHLEFALSGHDDFYLIARFELECLHYCIRQTNRKAVSPFSNSHKSPHDIQRSLYIIGTINAQCKET